MLIKKLKLGVCDDLDFEMRCKNGLKYFIIPSFESTGLVKHGVSTRAFKLYTGLYRFVSEKTKVEDKNEIIRDYRLFCDLLGLDMRDLVSSDQVHGDGINVVSSGDRGKGISRESDIIKTDGLITNDKGVALITYYADCVPLFFLDVATPAIGISHSGWRGSLKKIGQKTVIKMMDQFGSKPENMLVGIGPSIKKCCYEVDRPIIESLKKAFITWEQFVEKSRESHWMLDLVKINVLQLEEVGIKRDNITISSYCTSCRNDLFYSYRADGKREGSLAAVIQLK
jgi:YfiH family protein